MIIESLQHKYDLKKCSQFITFEIYEKNEFIQTELQACLVLKIKDNNIIINNFDYLEINPNFKFQSYLYNKYLK